MTNENEVYSLRQLEAFNALSQNEKLKIQERTAENKIVAITKFESKKEEIESIKPNSPKFVNPKDIEIDLIDNPIRRVFISNQLNGTTIKANPKAVTASVFKTLPTGVNPLKHKLCTSNNGERLANKNIETSQTTKFVTSSFMKVAPTHQRNTFGKVHSTISEPSILPRQTVVTASLFQPRRTPKENATSDSLTANRVELRTAETMNKSFCISNDDACQTTCEYFG